MGNWDNKVKLAIKAKEHTSEMNKLYADNIKYSVDNSIIFTGNGNNINCSNGCRYTYNYEAEHKDVEFIISNKYSSEAIMDATEDGVTVLNFASYKQPGGGFLRGSSAQEEALCHDSFLYNVLDSNKLMGYYAYNNINLNNGMYTDRAIFSPYILFFNNENSKYCNVITCAAPNNSVSIRFGSFTQETNNNAMLQRIVFLRIIADICNDIEYHDRIILGAWGCGVFKQDYKFVISNLIKEFTKSTYKTVELALPDKVIRDYANKFIQGEIS